MAGEGAAAARDALARGRAVPGGAVHSLPRRKPRSSRMSERERLILGELARGRSTDEIAEALDVSPHTVRTHIKNGMRKLDAKTRAHAVAIALSDGAIAL